MNEEEKKAVEFVKKRTKELKKYAKRENELVYDDIVLNLINKLQKENEELKQDRNNNYQMIALAQNEALGYMQGYEDGKKLKRSAVQNIIENQQYYIFQKQIEKYEEHIEKLQKENEKALAEYMKWQKQELGQKDKIIDLMAETINNHDIDEDICKQMGQKQIVMNLKIRKNVKSVSNNILKTKQTEERIEILWSI